MFHKIGSFEYTTICFTRWVLLSITPCVQHDGSFEYHTICVNDNSFEYHTICLT